MPRQLVAMSYDGSWRRVAVQVDKRVETPFSKIYGVSLLSLPKIKTLAYADAFTFTGVDASDAIDANDQVVLMADDAAGRPAGRPTKWTAPPDVVPGWAVQVELTDPLIKDGGGGNKAWLFLFQSPAPVKSPRRGVKYVFKLKSGSYHQTYKVIKGPNAEDSTVRTPVYTRHFSDRWISDAMSVLPPCGGGQDILDMDKVLIRPGLGLRSVRTFSRGEGAFIANKSGPVRAIRSYTGCNSGPLTQREFFFYDAREDCHTFLRVHRLPGVLSFTDHSAAARGMTYYNNMNTQGVKIDGRPDTVRSGRLQWEMISGSQGTVITVHQFNTDIPGLRPGSYYLDEADSTTTQVTGDSHAYASSGIWINQRIPNTDPLGEGFSKLSTVRIRFYHSSAATVSDAQRRYAEVVTPLEVKVSPVDGADRAATDPQTR